MVFIDIMDIAGTAAFAISGILMGIKSKLDFFGLFVLGVFTACGGGLIRDVILNRGMPVLFTDSKYMTTIVISTILTCLLYRFITRLSTFIQIFDALGLGTFTILTAYQCILLKVPLIGIIFISVLTGVGGGIVRDIMVNEVPLIFRGEIYALASIIGAFSFYILYNNLDSIINLYLCILIVFAVRIISMYFNINLPVLKTDGKLFQNGKS
ncbi:MAG TPA: trimeric intracellular cation channel family protein [Pseudobacteroides sp.]|uniref:trimeric intracellular cation channel family protein n=1 Tax=Pseudobacteroides sp. TaxID=1968840 RepID=UPI002F92D308